MALTKTSPIEQLFSEIFVILSRPHPKDDLETIDSLNNHHNKIFTALSDEVFKSWAGRLTKNYKERNQKEFVNLLKKFYEQNNAQFLKNLINHLEHYRVFIEFNKMIFNKIKDAIEKTESMQLGIDYMTTTQKNYGVDFNLYLKNTYPSFLGLFEHEEAFVEETKKLLQGLIKSIDRMVNDKSLSPKDRLFKQYQLEIEFLKACNKAMNHISDVEMTMHLKMIDVSYLKQAYNLLFDHSKRNIKGILENLALFIRKYVNK